MEIPPEVLAALRGMLSALARVRPAHVKRLLAIARESQAALEARLKALAPGRYTTQEVRGKLVQVRAAVEVLGVDYGRKVGDEIEAVGRLASTIGRDGLVDQVKAWGTEFPQAARLLSRPRDASDVLDPGLLEYYQRSRETYGLEAITKMRGVLARSALEGRTIVETWEDLSKQLDMPEWRAERIVRTEQSFAANRRQILDAIDTYGDDAEEIFAKQLVATFDNRTGEDSVRVHEQVRRLIEPFNDGKRDYQHPPNRPNDREVVVLVPLDEVEGELGPPEGARKETGADDSRPDPAPKPSAFGFGDSPIAFMAGPGQPTPGKVFSSGQEEDLRRASKEWFSSLNQNQRAAWSKWSGPGHARMRSVGRKPGVDLDTYEALGHLLNALKSAPRWTGKMFRGISSEELIDDSTRLSVPLVIGGVFKVGSLRAFSLDERVGLAFAAPIKSRGNGIVIEVREQKEPGVYYIAPASSHPHQEELLTDQRLRAYEILEVHPPQEVQRKGVSVKVVRVVVRER